MNAVQRFVIPKQGIEVHLPKGHNYVAVCWDIGIAEQTDEVVEQLPDGGTRTIHTVTRRPQRKGKPFIRFVNLCQNETEVWIEDDSPDEGGMTRIQAIIIVAELNWAIEYLKQVDGQG